MKSPRLNRLFNPQTGRCLDVAVDHGVFGEGSFLAGIEDLPKVVSLLAAAGPDAIQLTLGQARHLQNLPLRHKPALVVRTDVANLYGSAPPRSLFSRLIECAVEQALRIDAACVVVNLLSVPDLPELTDECIRNISALKAQCVRWDMPLMIEPLAFRRSTRGGFISDGDPARIVPLVRQAAELGADVIKADATDDASIYRRVVSVAGDVPVLARGGSKARVRDILVRTDTLIEQGAAGIVYGRNIVQHRDPPAITRALMALVHQRIGVDRALAMLQTNS